MQEAGSQNEPEDNRSPRYFDIEQKLIRCEKELAHHRQRHLDIAVWLKKESPELFKKMLIELSLPNAEHHD